MRTTRQKFNLILTLALWLTMAQTAWAADETKTFEMSSVTGSSNPLTYDGHNFLCITGSEGISKYSGMFQFDSQFQDEGTIRLYPRISGKVKRVEFTSAKVSFMIGGSGYIKIGKNDTWSNSYTEDINSFTSMVFEYASGIQLDNEEDYLEIKSAADMMCSFYINAASSSKLIITYEPTASTATHTHNFSFNAVGNTLTATCGHSDGLDCSLADANYQATLTLSPSVDTYYRPNSTYSATLNLTAFNVLTGLNATATDITYVDNISGDNLGTAAPTTAGNYTASVTVTVGGTNYTLTTDFTVNVENSINSNIRQISVSKTSARNDEEITITFTPRLHELVNTLTVTGTTTNMSIGNGVTKVDEYTYTFLMPYEEVTVGATFKSSNPSLYKHTISSNITGSGEVDYNAEEYLGAGDAITMTFKPYLQGNLEKGSVLLEGLTVTGATTSMSVGNGITDNNDNTYTFTMPDENVTVTATAWLSADAILTGTINEPINVKQGNGIQIGYEGKHTYVNDGALPLVIHDGNTLRLVGGTDIYLDRADKNAIVCEGDATIELVANSAYHKVGVNDDSNRNSGKAVIKVSPAGKTLTIRVADESTESVNFKVESRSNVKGRSCNVIGCDEGGTCGSIVVESGEVEFWDYFNKGGKAIRTTDGTITFGYKFPNDCIYLYGNADGGCSEGTMMIEDGKQYHADNNINLKYSGTLDLQGKNYLGAKADKYTVVFDENGGSDVDNQIVPHGMKATEPATPTRDGYTFEGWKNGEDIYDFNSVVTSYLALIAAWTKNVLTLANGSDNGANIETAATSGKVYEVTLSGRTLYKDGDWNTLTLPFAVDMTAEGCPLNAAGVEARTLTEASIEGTTLNLTFGDAVTTLSAGVPYIIKWTKDDVNPTIDDPVFSGVTIDATDNRFDNQVSGDERVRFLGTYKSTTFTDEDKSILFLGTGNALYYPQPDIDTENPENSKYPTIGAQRAYFKIGEDGAPQLARRLTAFNIDFGEEQTGIVSVSKESGSEGVAGAWFSMDGVRIDGKPTRKGLYIHNGRKEVVK